MCVAASATEEHRLREKGLTPEGNETGGVEMTWMKSPEAHQAVFVGEIEAMAVASSSWPAIRALATAYVGGKLIAAA